MGGGFDFRNNVLFNWRHRTMDGGDGSSRVNVINNYYKPGPATQGALRYRICKCDARNSRDRYPGFGKWYVTGNFVYGNEKVTADNWDGGVQFSPPVKQRDEIIPMGTPKDVRVDQPFHAAAVVTHSAPEAFELVLALGGASLPRRDPVDLRVVDSVRTGNTSTKTGILETPADVGGWPMYKADRSPTDSDQDGMPDEWELKYGLNPKEASDAVKDADGDGYTNIEEYLNGTDPTRFVDYTKSENNVSPLHKAAPALQQRKP